MVGVFLSEGLDVPVQTASLADGHFVAEVDAGLIQGNRIKGGQHADIRDDGNVILGMAVTEGRDVADQRDMERRAVLHHRIGILRDLA